MTIYRELAHPSASRARWTDVDFVAVVRVEAGRLVILNSDGTETHLLSDDESFSQGLGGLTGTVSAAVRTDNTGGTHFESIEGLSAPVSSLLAAGGNLFDVVLDSGAQIFWQQPVDLGVFLPIDLGETWVTQPVVPVFAIADFSESSAGVSVTLSAAGAIEIAGGETEGSGLTSVIGSGFADGITGNSVNNTLIAGAGDDLLVGGSGDDTLAGGLGHDTLMLGVGNDVVEFHAGDGWDTVLDFGAEGHDTIQLAGFSAFASFADLIDQQAIVTLGDRVEVRLGGGDGLVLMGVGNLGNLTAAQFGF